MFTLAGLSCASERAADRWLPLDFALNQSTNCSIDFGFKFYQECTFDNENIVCTSVFERLPLCKQGIHCVLILSPDFSEKAIHIRIDFVDEVLSYTPKFSSAISPGTPQSKVFDCGLVQCDSLFAHTIILLQPLRRVPDSAALRLRPAIFSWCGKHNRTPRTRT